MRQTLRWLLGVGSAGIALVFVLTGVREPVVPRTTIAPVKRVAAPEDAPLPRTEQSGSQRDTTPPVTRPSEAGTTEDRAAVAKEKVVFTFADEPAMHRFIVLWRERESLLTRLRTLEGYWNKEQAAQVRLDRELATATNDGARASQGAELQKQRESVTLRLQVLQTYWDRDQTALTRVNQSLSDAYGIDLTTAYTLNLQRRVLLEQTR